MYDFFFYQLKGMLTYICNLKEDKMGVRPVFSILSL